MRKIVKIQLLLILVSMVMFSCLKDEWAENQAEHDKKMEELKIEYGIDETMAIGDNIYLKPLEQEPYPGAEPPEYDDVVIVDYIGRDYDGNVFDVSYVDVAVDNDVYRNDFIYGPARLYVNYTRLGFQKAIQEMTPKERAIMLIPGDQWDGYWNPVVYDVTLYKVIEDIETYNNEQLALYLDSLGISTSDLLPESDGIWAKDFSGRLENGLSFGDTVILSLHGYYVEADTTYMNSFPGRQFFPISNSGDTLIYAYGEEFFPVTYAVNEAVKYMLIGDTADIVAKDDYGYDDTGFAHPYTGEFIIPPDMPLHYTLQLIDTILVGN